MDRGIEVTSSALYVYAVIPDIGRRDWAAIGLDGADVRAEGDGALAALVHDVPDGRPYAGSDEQVRAWVLQHSRVVELAWDAAGTVLPVSFDVLVRGGDDMPAERRLREWLRDARDQLTAGLDRLRDRVELKVEIGFPGKAQGQPSTLSDRPPAGGLQRLQQKRRELEREQVLGKRADDLYRVVRRELASRAEDLVEHPRSRPEGLKPVFSGSLLVRRDQMEDVGRELARLQAREPDLVIKYLGPWPPYSFADAAMQSIPSGTENARLP
jgi:hypothetical protein